tara:strand:- start:946 stop:1074 length:129 start_codon:yes stop_codon:yes gene_type:complete
VVHPKDKSNYTKENGYASATSSEISEEDEQEQDQSPEIIRNT